jgi:hypothetical protein
VSDRDLHADRHGHTDVHAERDCDTHAYPFANVYALPRRVPERNQHWHADEHADRDDYGGPEHGARRSVYAGSTGRRNVHGAGAGR